ncbi:MAG: nucleoside-diphosphate kinase [Sarcina ventriculi]|uniref:Nucleoside-diphosphate kinase n=2 Tax=Sarcina TaxID=1266 RepID=A0ACD1BCD1_9CLOT|nr:MULTISPECIES: nucleoside-diphosphate kinase [Sarcina]MDO4403058.1 nucleoside-diphosphate kinase [Clostridiaceae bacterium]MBU5322331.1 nucleoside-diphosphate kinase [Sarcina ventriculi]MCI5635455.1 nucleoside-diphosphate kinase [Sarcina ventriculi]MDD7373525.1 nucleoside-diphosphate kinase [Sarcina ventriculi]MDY7062773.1 nucleoside-diphosphate kinase [Sarcina ventriculi]
MEKTLVLIKPDGVERGLVGQILSVYERKCLRICKMKLIQADENLAKKHYEEHKDKPFFKELVDYLVSGKLVAMIIEGESAISIVRKENGDKDPLKADCATIRGMYANSRTKNLVHASDSLEAAKREISLWFPEV